MKLSIFYVYEKQNKPEKLLQNQKLSSDRIQVLPIKGHLTETGQKQVLDHLPEAEGEYLTVLYEGDRLQAGWLDQACEKLEQSNMAFVMPYIFPQFELKNKCEYFRTESRENREIDIRENQLVFPLELHGLVLRTAQVQKTWRGCDLETEKEKQLVYELLKNQPIFYYMGEAELKYLVPREQDFFNCISVLQSEWYYDSLEKGILPLLEREAENGEVNMLLQCMTLHMVELRLCANTNNRNKHVISEEEVPEYYRLLKKVLDYVTVETILKNESAMLKVAQKMRMFVVRLKAGRENYYPDVKGSADNIQMMFEGIPFADIENLSVRIELINYENGNLEIDGNINDFIADAQGVVYARFDNHCIPVIYNGRYALQKCFGVSYYRNKTFHVSVPVPDSEKIRSLTFGMKADDHEYELQMDFPMQTSRFSKALNAGYWRFGKYISYWKDNQICVEKYTWTKMVKKELHMWKQMYCKTNGMFRDQLPLRMLNFLCQPYFSRKKIWLFFDKIYKGGDSSEYLYKYALGQKDGITKYYLLDESCPDYKRMRAEGYKPIKRGSLIHRLAFLNADIIVASNSTIFAFNNYEGRKSEPIRGLIHSDTACVQHGMSIQKIALAQQRLRDNTRLYFCASKYEIENLSKPVYDYEGYDALKLTGVPRYDGLKDRKEKVLLFSPTWRMNSVLPAYHGESYARDYNPNFKETSYYKVYNGLLNDPQLLEAARKYGYRIQYVLHPLISPQYEDFTQNDLVEIIPSTGEMSYEKLFCEAALMVTDFSGVQFDFAYMRKPVVYLHHEDIPQHYEEGTFHYRTMGFGEICHTNQELIDILCRYMEHNCEMPEEYRAHADDFFYYSDHHNCERIYQEMIKYQNRKEKR